jgi:glycosyltransferase involved in cell wall biosynthesis
MPDLSVIICTHNPRQDYLRCALDALKAQTLPKEQWELLLIDNASNEHLASRWDLSWHPHARHIREAKVGLSFARLRGFAECQGQVVIFVDDDNVLEKDWLERGLAEFRLRPEMGVYGGMTIPIYEVEPPDWLPPLAQSLAVGKPQAFSGLVQPGAFLWGAGLAIRREAWINLLKAGFDFLATDRCGEVLVGGGDVELCRAMQLVGWQIWYDEDLKLQHLVDAKRCNWKYFRRLYRGHGATSVFLDAYGEIEPRALAGIRYCWWWRALSVCKQIMLEPADLLAVAGIAQEGSRRVLRLESRLGRLVTLVKIRASYHQMLERVQNWKAQVARLSAPIAKPKFSSQDANA